MQYLSKDCYYFLEKFLFIHNYRLNWLLMTITFLKMTTDIPETVPKQGIIADLHIHSTASDGEYSPEQIAGILDKLNIKVAALTDHDTFRGFQNFKKSFNGIAVPGVELSVTYRNVGLHLLAYGFNPEHKAFTERLTYFQDVRFERIEKICERLCELGLTLTIEEVIENYPQDTAFGRPHIARAMMARGYIKTFNEAFRKYIGNGKPAYVAKARLTFEEATELIKDAGGISILAHPGLFLKELSFDVIKMLAVNGFEAYHPNHTPSFSRIIIDHCLKHDLPYTGGSDFHDLRRNKINVLGKWGLSNNEWEYFKDFMNHNCYYEI